MDEKLKSEQKQVMLVQQSSDGRLRAVSSVDGQGNITTCDPTEQNISNLLNVNTAESAFEAFFHKMMQEADNPSHTGIFVMAESAFRNLIQIDFAPDELEQYRISLEQNPSQEQRFQPMDTSKIDLEDLARKGIKMESLEPHLKALSYGHKSNGLIEMSPELEAGGMRVTTKGRVSLEEQADGSLKVIPHYWQEKPNLDIPFHGILLDEQTKVNLLATRHAGRVLDLELSQGELTPCFVSIDKLTNTLEALPVAMLERRTSIKNAELSEGLQKDFYSGSKILLEGFTTRAGYKRDAYIQVDAAERNYEFTYDGLDRNRYAEENKEVARRNAAARQSSKQQQADTQFEVTIHPKILGTYLPDEAYKQWSEAAKDPSKRADVKAFFIRGLHHKEPIKTVDGRGETFDAWVKPDFEEGKMKFYKWNPDRAVRRGAKVIPVNESRTQVAVNSEGKSAEAVKDVREPLKQGQQRLTEAQHTVRQQKQKRKGVTM